MSVKYNVLEVLRTPGIMLDKHCSIIITNFLQPANTKIPLDVSEYRQHLPNQNNNF